jgi:hypothetical protein
MISENDEIKKEENKEASPADRDFLLLPLVLGEPVKVYLWIEEEEPREFEDYANVIKQAYQQWFDNAANRVIRSGRKEEFQDVLPYLQRPVSVEVVRSEEADLKILVYQRFKNFKLIENQEKKRRDFYLGIYSHSKKTIEISKKISLQRNKYVLMHELGHSLGFADQYYAERWRADEVYSSSSVNTIMNDDINKLTCDDADGLINLIDQKLKLYRGGERGWKSLCASSKEYYKGGMPVDTNRYRVQYLEDDHLMLAEYENGKQINAEELWLTEKNFDPLTPIEEAAVLKKNSIGQRTLVKGKQGENIHYIRQYERLEKIITKDGKLLTYSYTYPMACHLMFIQKFRVDGEIGILEAEISVQGKTVGIVYTLPAKEAKVILALDPTKKNEEYKSTWIGNWEKVLVSQSKKEGFVDQFAIEQIMLEQRLLKWGKNLPKEILRERQKVAKQ